MEAIPIGEFKAHFSTILERVKQGEKIVISSGKKREKVALLVPYESKIETRQRRKLGLLQGKARCVIRDNFSMSDAELLSS